MSDTETASKDVTATLQYLIPGEEKPIYIASQAGADAALNIGAEFEEKTVCIQDARQLPSPASLDQQGFTLVDHPTTINNFYPLETIREEYEKEIINLVLAASGGCEAIVFDHTLRSDSRKIRGQHSTREPAAVIHNDYSDASAEKRLQDLLPIEKANQQLKKRYAIINVWRSINLPVINFPLACCDAQSTDDSDLIASERRAKERIGELQLATYNPKHLWYYYPEMTVHEALLLKTFDSAKDGRARRTIHTAFDNPLATSNSPARESIESRLLVFFS